MTGGEHSAELERLREEIEVGGARPQAIDRILSTLGPGRVPSADLLSLLSDRAAYDEGMFSLIHAAESVDHQAYVRALLSAFPRLVETSPRWASIVLMRTLNNPATQVELVRQLLEAPPEAKAAIREMCSRINGVSPQFLSKTTAVYVAAA